MEITGQTAGRHRDARYPTNIPSWQARPSMTVLENIMSGENDGVARAALDVAFRLPFIRSRERRLRSARRLSASSPSLEWTGRVSAGPTIWYGPSGSSFRLDGHSSPQPKLLLLDEPASGMGHKEIEKVEQIIRDIRDIGTTVVVVSHDVKMLMNLSDLVTVLNFGEKIAEGMPNDIQKRPPRSGGVPWRRVDAPPPQGGRSLGFLRSHERPAGASLEVLPGRDCRAHRCQRRPGRPRSWKRSSASTRCLGGHVIRRRGDQRHLGGPQCAGGPVPRSRGPRCLRLHERPGQSFARRSPQHAQRG